MRARIIALEGIDQSGKRTQTRLLAHRLRQLGFTVRTISFPIYGSATGRLIKDYLNSGHNYPPEALHMLYSLNRWENQKEIENLLDEADFVIADRYSPSNIAYGISKGLDLKWLIELDKGLPTADLVIVLDVPVSSSFERKSKERDVHERSVQLLSKVRKSYKALAPRFRWSVIDAHGSARDVDSQIWKLVTHSFSLPLPRSGKSKLM